MSESNGAAEKQTSVFSEFMASVVVFLVALPLCLGVAVASGVPATTGLVSGIVGGLIVGTFAGSKLQVSGPAAGLAVIVYEIVETHGLEKLGVIVLAAGLLQAIAGKLHLGQWFRAVSPAVIYGMLAGIGVLIFGSQFHVMIDSTPDKNGLWNLVTIPQAIWTALNPPEGATHFWAFMVGLLTLAVLIFWNWARSRVPAFLKPIPPPLLAVIAAVALAKGMDLTVNYVDIPTDLREMVTFPTVATLTSLSTPSVFGSAVALAFIASAEALLCALAVDKLHTGDRSDLDQELFAQGIGNMVGGVLGALPVTGVIVRSSANVESGATTRWSAVLHGIWIVLAVLSVPLAVYLMGEQAAMESALRFVMLSNIPVAALAAILVYIGFRLVNLDIPRGLWAKDKGEFAIYVVTVSAIVSMSLLEGLLIGILLSFLKLAWSLSDLRVEGEQTDGRYDLHLHGSGTFVGLPVLARGLEKVPNGLEVHIHIEQVDYVDHACFELLSDWRHQYESRGGSVIVEWDALQQRFAGKQSAA